MDPFNLLWLIPVLPLVGATINGVFGKRLSEERHRDDRLPEPSAFHS